MKVSVIGCADGRVVGSRKLGRDYVIDVPAGGTLSVTGLLSADPVTGVVTRHREPK